jgi:hypothetical protein
VYIKNRHTKHGSWQPTYYFMFRNQSYRNQPNYTYTYTSHGKYYYSHKYSVLMCCGGFFSLLYIMYLMSAAVLYTSVVFCIVCQLLSVCHVFVKFMLFLDCQLPSFVCRFCIFTNTWHTDNSWHTIQKTTDVYNTAADIKYII